MKPQTFLKYILIFKTKIFLKNHQFQDFVLRLGSKNIAPKNISKYPFVVVVVAVYMSLKKKMYTMIDVQMFVLMFEESHKHLT